VFACKVHVVPLSNSYDGALLDVLAALATDGLAMSAAVPTAAAVAMNTAAHLELNFIEYRLLGESSRGPP
jgi:hypothetical protein